MLSIIADKVWLSAALNTIMIVFVVLDAK